LFHHGKHRRLRTLIAHHELLLPARAFAGPARRMPLTVHFDLPARPAGDGRPSEFANGHAEGRLWAVDREYRLVGIRQPGSIKACAMKRAYSSGRGVADGCRGNIEPVGGTGLDHGLDDCGPEIVHLACGWRLRADHSTSSIWLRGRGVTLAIESSITCLRRHVQFLTRHWCSRRGSRSRCGTRPRRAELYRFGRSGRWSFGLAARENLAITAFLGAAGPISG